LPAGIAVDTRGTVYIIDIYANAIRMISTTGACLKWFFPSTQLSAMLTIGYVYTLTGMTPGFAEGFGANAEMYQPHGLAISSSGKLYVADTANNRIRVFDTTG
jgi:sugar lactone lactonase YvrE